MVTIVFDLHVDGNVDGDDAGDDDGNVDGQVDGHFHGNLDDGDGSDGGDRDDGGGGGGGGDTRIPAGTVEMAERFCEQHRQGCFQVSVHVT